MTSESLYIHKYYLSLQDLDGEPLPDPSLDGIPLSKADDIDGVPSKVFEVSTNSHLYTRPVFTQLVFSVLFLLRANI